MEITYLPDGIVLSQKKFTTDLLRDSGFTKFKKVVTPLPIKFKLQSFDSPLFSGPTKYRSLVGKINFLTNTRYDSSFTVQALSQYMQSPTEHHYQALTHTLNYIAAIAGQGILLKATNNLCLQAYSDSDWGACLDTQRSVTGYIVMFGKSPIRWKSINQILFQGPHVKPSIMPWLPLLLKLRG